MGSAVALIGHARVSTDDQKLALQHALNAAGYERIFDDHASGAKTDRPGLGAALAYLRAGDTWVVWNGDARTDQLRAVVSFTAWRGSKANSALPMTAAMAQPIRKAE